MKCKVKMQSELLHNNNKIVRKNAKCNISMLVTEGHYMKLARIIVNYQQFIGVG